MLPFRTVKQGGSYWASVYFCRLKPLRAELRQADVDDTSEPLKQAEVLADGRFRFEDVPLGQYRIKVAVPGFQPAYRAVQALPAQCGGGGGSGGAPLGWVVID